MRRYAEQADDKANGGNGNGVIDGNEIKKFKDIVKQKTGYNFDFSSMKQVKNKTIAVQDENGFIFNTTTEIANKYRNATSTKTIDWMNGKKEGHALLVPSRKTLDIPYMNDDDYKSSKQSVDKQEDTVSSIIQKQNEAKKLQKAKEYHEMCKSVLEICVDWFIGLFK